MCWRRRNGAPAAEFFGNECVSGPFCIRFMNQMHREILYMCDASERSLACRYDATYDTRQDLCVFPYHTVGIKCDVWSQYQCLEVL